ncbi:MAG: hypothetical protein IPJ77_02490 [Planctomycetes bacterium]|nr:hypothetical protein [Planctomycetota bacterium]
MTGRPWSLARRLSGLFLVSISVFVIGIAGVTAWLVRASVSKDLDGLPHEELVELREHIGLFQEPREALERKFDELAQEHTPCAFAWRVWMDDGPVLDFGETSLLTDDHPGKREQEGSTADASGTLRWKTERVGDHALVGVVIDGARRFELLYRYEGYAMVLIAAAILLAFGVATLVFRRVSKVLAEVAARARAVKDPGAEVDMRIPDAPVEIQEVSEALREMLENIRGETQQARLFTAGLAHELRSPVQNLVGETEVALIQDRDAATYREVLRSNLDELRSLGDAIDNLVTICSVGDRQRTRAREHFDLAAEAELRLRREGQIAERHGIHFELETRGDCRLVGDREALLRAVRNITANAIQWSERGARVEVRIEGRDDELIVTVDDAGPGVPEELRERIYEPFFRGPSARGRRIGYGLGLALARTAVEEQGGTISIDRSPLGGARFRLALPRRSSSVLVAAGR